MSRFWIVITILLVAVIVAGCTVIWLRYEPGKPVEISMVEDEEQQGQIYIDGAVANPGIYPLFEGDTIESLIKAAGGFPDNADFTELKLHISGEDTGDGVQRININRAEAWLLEALPGIGEVLAGRIVEYRLENGSFRSINELQKVDGIGGSTIKKIQGLITVSD